MPSSAERDRTNGQRGREARQLHTHGETESERRARRGGGGSGEDGVAVDDDGSHKVHANSTTSRTRVRCQDGGGRVRGAAAPLRPAGGAPQRLRGRLRPGPRPRLGRVTTPTHTSGAACRGGRPHRKPFAGSALNMKRCCDAVSMEGSHPPFGALPAHDPVSRIRCRKACSDHMALQ